MKGIILRVKLKTKLKEKNVELRMQNKKTQKELNLIQEYLESKHWQAKKNTFTWLQLVDHCHQTHHSEEKQNEQKKSKIRKRN